MSKSKTKLRHYVLLPNGKTRRIYPDSRVLYIISEGSGLPLYVGKTVGSLKRRLGQHLNSRDSKIGRYIHDHKAPNDLIIRIYWLKPTDNIDKLEKYLIRLYDPAFNYQHKPENGPVEFGEIESPLDGIKNKTVPLLSAIPQVKHAKKEERIAVIDRIFKLLSIKQESINKENFKWVKQEIREIAREMDRVKL